MVPTRNTEELELMRKSGKITAMVLKKVIEAVVPGVTLKQLDQLADEEFSRFGAGASFKTVPDYHWATCMNINDEVVHGIPRDIAVKEGDVLTIDLGAMYKGWHTDTAWTVVVGGKPTAEQAKFLEAGEQSMWKGIAQCREGKRLGDVGAAMQKVIEDAGYSVVRSLVGHGIGRSGHEEPEVPGYGKEGTGMKLKAGMTLAIEIIYNAGKPDVYTLDDGWTIASDDGSISGCFEMTVVVGKKHPEVLTNWKTL